MHAQENQTLYPFVLEPIFKQRIWGGRRLEAMFAKRLPPTGPIGESWEISCRGQDNSVIRNGRFAGKTLRDMAERFPEQLLGSAGSPHFPLLNKFIDANALLSVQVHPDEQSARRFPGAEAKTEAWYILHADPGATLVKGLRPGTTRERFCEAIRTDTVPSVLHTFPVFTGDTVFVPAGCVHAMGAGLVVCEIQENSDTTFRVYDWDRVGADGKPRQLHIEQAIEAIHFDDVSPEKVPPVETVQGGNRRELLVACRQFAAELLEIAAPVHDTTGGRRLDTYMMLEGAATIRGGSGSDVPLQVGDSAIIPASLGEYAIIPSGRCSVIRVFVPDIEADIASRLRAAGLTEDVFGETIFL